MVRARVKDSTGKGAPEHRFQPDTAAPHSPAGTGAGPQRGCVANGLQVIEGCVCVCVCACVIITTVQLSLEISLQ